MSKLSRTSSVSKVSDEGSIVLSASAIDATAVEATIPASNHVGDPVSQLHPRPTKRRMSKFVTRAEHLDAAIGESDPTIGPRAAAENTGFQLAGKPDSTIMLQNSEDQQRYARLGEIGRGGCGIVERALDRQLEREVAVKRLSARSTLRDSEQHRFIREAKITSQLQHPGIVPIHELGDSNDGEAYYVMRLLDGGTLRDQIANTHRSSLNSRKPRTASQLMDLIHPLLDRYVDICNATAYAHRQGIIHRDLKPSNVMIGEFGETIVLDWGLAQIRPDRSNPDTLTFESEGTIVGSPAYMSPEQARGEIRSLSTKSDIYSLGVMLFEIVAGRHPHTGRSIEQVLQRVRCGVIDSLIEIQPAAPKSLIAIVETAMSSEPGERYADAESLVDDVKRLMIGERVSVYRESYVDICFRWIRKNRLVASVVGCGIIIFSIMVAAFSLFLHRSHLAEREAKVAAIEAHRDAVDRLMAAREVTDQWLDNLVGSLDFYSSISPVRQEILDQAILHYKSLLLNHGPTSVSLFQTAPRNKGQPADISIMDLHEQAICHLRLADLFRVIGDRRQALLHYRLAESQLVQLEQICQQSVKKWSWLIDQSRLEQIDAIVGELAADGSRDLGTEHIKKIRWLEHTLEALKSGDYDGSEGLNFKAATCFARLNIIRFRRFGTNEGVQVQQHELDEAVFWARWLVDKRGTWHDEALSLEAHIALADWRESRGEHNAAILVWTQVIEDLTDWRSNARNRPDQIYSLGYCTMRRGACYEKLSDCNNAVIDYRNALTSFEKIIPFVGSEDVVRDFLADTRKNLTRLTFQQTEVVN